ncbi:hypothetical protein RHGRI_014395 [Rhododendron griersonianum]|uniref:Uncharacterized protein n=1 Tax=Rhododendron griersonianum TaxID=479676 RepID=A0AAV6K9I9_9ERIC|nr:hypothetical protein RHGRI_014395 [Rhododendron griersonianum]
MMMRQFPIRLAYALTINKSQGQSVKFEGVDLRTPMFSYGQLYVALSRCISFDRISVLFSKDELDSTTNIVFILKCCYKLCGSKLTTSDEGMFKINLSILVGNFSNDLLFMFTFTGLV